MAPTKPRTLGDHQSRKKQQHLLQFPACGRKRRLDGRPKTSAPWSMDMYMPQSAKKSTELRIHMDNLWIIYGYIFHLISSIYWYRFIVRGDCLAVDLEHSVASLLQKKPARRTLDTRPGSDQVLCDDICEPWVHIRPWPWSISTVGL